MSFLHGQKDHEWGNNLPSWKEHPADAPVDGYIWDGTQLSPQGPLWLVVARGANFEKGSESQPVEIPELLSHYSRTYFLHFAPCLWRTIPWMSLHFLESFWRWSACLPCPVPIRSVMSKGQRMVSETGIWTSGFSLNQLGIKDTVFLSLSSVSHMWNKENTVYLRCVIPGPDSTDKTDTGSWIYMLCILVEILRSFSL